MWYDRLERALEFERSATESQIDTNEEIYFSVVRGIAIIANNSNNVPVNRK